MNPVPCLIVDDLEENLMALEALLRRDGLVLLRARSGTEALEILLKQEVALALVDVQMPEMDGFELAELMRGTERTRRVPIIFLTAGKTDRQRRFRGYEAGAVDFLEKPFEPDILKSKAEVFFDLFRQREELRSVAEQNAHLLAESRRNEEAARQSEASLRLALEASATGIWTWDVATDQMTWSPECYQIHGLSAGEFEGTGTAFFLLVHPEDRPRAAATIREAIARHQVYEDDFRILRPGGAIAWVANRGRADYDPNGQPIRMLGAITDVTDRKHAEIELARLNRTLQSADRRKDEFLATLAHELRNPLAPLRNSLSILRLTRGDDPDAVEAREVMSRQIVHMVRLIDDLMDAARISQGKIELRRESIDVRDVLEHAIESSRSLIDAARHALHVEVPEGPLPLDADLVRLAQVVGNLLNNAAKYTPAGGRIRLSAEVDRDQVIIRVSDNGTGLSAEMLDHVFDLFTQVDDTRDRAQGGLGIGLALVRKLVELHGGSVEVASPGIGLGSTFSVRLPLASRAATPETAPEAPGIEVPQQPISHRILVVDDNTDSACTLAQLLKIYGHQTRVAHDGPAALVAASAFRPDLILLDLGLPGMNGNEVCRKIRANPDLAGTSIVALTGWGSEPDKQRAREAGFDQHLVKPVDFQEVEKILDHLPKPNSPNPSGNASPR